MKRAVCYQQLVTISAYRELLACEADFAMDTVLLNVGQKDLATMMAVWTDNLSEGHYIGIAIALKNYRVPIFFWWSLS